MPTRIQLRRGLAADWTSANPVLASGEMGVETDTGLVKVGNGVDGWVSLDYLTTDVAADVTTLQGQMSTAQSDINAIESGMTDIRNSLYVSDAVPAALYNDYLVPGYALKPGATSPQFLAFRGNIFAYAFAGTGGTSDEAFFAVHFVHDIKPGSTPTFHVHWSHIIGAPTGNVKWNIEYTIAKGYGTTAYPTTSTVSTVQAAGAQYLHHITPDDDMPMTAAFEPDSLLLGRVWRNPADGSDTFANDAYLLQLDLHYEIGQIGTLERNRPFTGF